MSINPYPTCVKINLYALECYHFAVDVLEDAAALQGHAANGGGYKRNNPLNITSNLSVQLTTQNWESLNSSFPAAFAVYVDVKAGSELFIYIGGFSVKVMPTLQGQAIVVELPWHVNYSVEYTSNFDYENIGISLKGSILEIYLDCTLLDNVSLLEQHIPTMLSRDVHLSGPALVCYIINTVILYISQYM